MLINVVASKSFSNLCGNLNVKVFGLPATGSMIFLLCADVSVPLQALTLRTHNDMIIKHLYIYINQFGT